MPKHFSPDETPEPLVTDPPHGSKAHKPVVNDRKKRLYKAEARYRQTRTHTGKGKTLRDHRQ